MSYNPFRNLGLKALAVVLATALWLSVAGEHLVERTVRVPLEFRNIPPALEIVGDAPGTVDVRVRGSSALLSRLQPGEIVAVLDLATARTGSRLFHLRNDEVRAPFGVEIAQVMPPTLDLEMEKTTRRTIPIVPATQGEPAPGFVVGGTSSLPATVDVLGPDTRVRHVSEATTEAVSVAGARATVHDTVTVGVVDSSVRLAQPQIAVVTVEILPAPVEHTIADVPVRRRNLGAGLRAELAPRFVRVTIRGSRAALAGLDSDSIQAFVELAGLGAGRYNLRVQADPAESFGVTGIEPAVVAVTIK